MNFPGAIAATRQIHGGIFDHMKVQIVTGDGWNDGSPGSRIVPGYLTLDPELDDERTEPELPP